MDQEQVKRNMTSRKLAEAVFGLVEGVLEGEELYFDPLNVALELLGREPYDKTRFFEIMERLCRDKIDFFVHNKKPTPTGPMTEQEASQFERVEITFGKYKGDTVGSLPIDYILFLTESNFSRQLSRYVQSVRFDRRQNG